MLDGLDRVIVAVSDLEAAERSYARLLGRRPSWRGAHPAQGTANVLFRLENTTLELLAPAGAGPMGLTLAERLEREGEGLFGLAFATCDAGACAAEWVARGLHPEPPLAELERDSESGAFREWLRVFLPESESRGLAVSAVEHRSPADLLPPAAPLGEAPACVSALDHAVVQTDDPEAARALYGERLGLRLALDREFPAWGARLLFFRVGGVTVEVAAPLEGGESPPAAYDRLWGLSWWVPDADAARARVVEAGFEASPVRPGRKPGTRVLTVRGPTCGVATLFLEAGEPHRSRR